MITDNNEEKRISETKVAIAGYVVNELEGDIESIEENAGSMWIKTTAGKIYSVMVVETQPWWWGEEDQK